MKLAVVHFARRRTRGFTIVELLIVIVVVAVLAAITIVAYNGVQDRARQSKISSDLAMLQRAIMTARVTQNMTMYPITGSSYTASACVSKTAGTDLAVLPQSDTCWTRYNTTLDAISTASGANVRGMVDPWGRPYFIDENEIVDGACNKDLLAVYALPTNGSAKTSLTYVPLYVGTGC